MAGSEPRGDGKRIGTEFVPLDYLANQPAIQSLDPEPEVRTNLEVRAPSKRENRWTIHVVIWILGSALGFGMSISDTGVDDGLRDVQEGEGYVERSILAQLAIDLVMGYPLFFFMNLCCFAPLAGSIFLEANDTWWDWPPWYLKVFFGQK
jgi:hypothetical protein